MNYSKITLGELLSSDNEVIKRHATGILKQYQNVEYRLNADDYNRNPTAYIRRDNYKQKQKQASLERDCVNCEITFEDDGTHDYCLKCR